MPKKMRLDAGQLQASEDRHITGILVPYNEVGKSNLGKIKIRPGALEIPKDPAGIVINSNHKNNAPIGRLVATKDTARGILSKWYIAKTQEGDQALEDVKSGKRRSLSVEADITKIKNGIVEAGKIFAAALVARPAFAGATLFAAEYDEETEEIVEDISEPAPENEVIDEFHEESEFTDENGVTWIRKSDSETVVDGDSTTTTTTIVEETIDPDEDETIEEEEPILVAKVPTAIQRRPGVAAPKKPAGMQLKQLYAHIANYSATRNPNDLKAILGEGEKAGALYAALNDIKATTPQSPGGKSISQVIAQPQWLGELWSGRDYQRRYIPLFNHGDLTSFTVSGYKFGTKPKVDKWSGNKTNVPSGPITFDPYNFDAEGFAGAHDIDRRFRDFNFPEFWEAYFKAMTDSYAEESDIDVLAKVLAKATPIERGSVPTDIDPGIVSIVDGALAILDTALPSFALVSKPIWRGILLTPKDKILEYLSQSLSLEDGDLAGFKILPARGDDLADGQVLVGARQASTVLELPGSPIRVEGLDMVKGGIDPGVFGYCATVIEEPKALALVTPGGTPPVDPDEE